MTARQGDGRWSARLQCASARFVGVAGRLPADSEGVGHVERGRGASRGDGLRSTCAGVASLDWSLVFPSLAVAKGRGGSWEGSSSMQKTAVVGTRCMRCRLDGNDQQGLCSLEPGTAPADQSPPPVTADSGRSKPRSAKSFPATEAAARMTMRRRPPRRERSHRQPDTCNYPSIPYGRDLESGARMVLGPFAGCRLRRGSSLSSTSSCPAGSRSPQSPVVRFASFDQAIEQRQLCSVSLGTRRAASTPSQRGMAGTQHGNRSHAEPVTRGRESEGIQALWQGAGLMRPAEGRVWPLSAVDATAQRTFGTSERGIALPSPRSKAPASSLASGLQWAGGEAR